jgi:membrane-associated protein
MSALLAPSLTFLQAYGYPVLWVIVCVAAFGVPVPVTLVLLAAGAFAEAGDFNVVLLGVLAISAAVAGDCAGYTVGRLWGSRVLRWLPHSRLGSRFITPQTVDRSRSYFHQHGAWAIVLTRTVLSALGSVTNLMAGAEVFPVRTFLFYDVLGESLGAVIPLGLGFAVGASWEAIGDIIGSVSLFALGLLCVVVVIYWLLMDLRRVKEQGRPKEQEATTRHAEK